MAQGDRDNELGGSGMKIRITESEHDCWYADKLGQEFKVHPSTQNYYFVVDGFHEGRTIKREHCEEVADFIDQDGNVSTETIKEQIVQNSKSKEEITRPKHYHGNGLEPIEVMKRIFTKEELRGFYRGNILKYSMRYQDKGGREDLIKLRDYTNMLIELEGE